MSAAEDLVPLSDGYLIVRRRAVDDFFGWWEGQGRPPFARATLQAHRAWLETRDYIQLVRHQPLAAHPKLVREARALAPASRAQQLY